jgi:hypothetical protein
MARKKSRKRKSSSKRRTKSRRSKTRRKASRRGKGHIPLPILEKRAGKLVRLVQKRGGRVK